MYKLIIILIITAFIWAFSFFMYPPFSNKDEKFILDPKLTNFEKMGINIKELKKLKKQRKD